MELVISQSTYNIGIYMICFNLFDFIDVFRSNLLFYLYMLVTRNSHKILIGKLKGNRSVGKPLLA
jgi:hypothetical protein